VSELLSLDPGLHCFSDIFLVCDDGKGGKSFQIWVNKKDEGFALSQTGLLPSGTQTVSFADVGGWFRLTLVISL